MDDKTDMNRFRKIVLGSEQVMLGTLTKESKEQTKPGIDTIEYLQGARKLLGLFNNMTLAPRI